jgi:hypothetical protein
MSSQTFIGPSAPSEGLTSLYGITKFVVKKIAYYSLVVIEIFKKNVKG